MAPEISNTSMLFLIVFVLIPLSLSYLYSLGLEKSITWSSVRGVIQLFLIGYLLTFLFGLQPIVGIPLMLLVMITVAGIHAAKKGSGIPSVQAVVLLILCAVEAVVLTMWLGFDMISFTAEQVIPMSGMIIGNSMVAIGLALERMKQEFRQNHDRLQAALALGATPKEASQLLIRKIVKAAMIPNVDGLKTIGLVQLPGMMTGLILAGVSPHVAIRYQIVISLSIFVAVSISAMLVTVFTYRAFYTQQMQLIRMETD
ncbi:iron export ABC transporter permease subunit FetB [Alkalihalobacillus oceani]|uniref:Iron export ABC transporter permease subunit FetB n=1 Tax=Halalkalibacter oceani TaxID=1653776 RepID=A0A9X2IMZ8_9BACI|nr:iron export ABC transporter permease subunit FetB [Halalkalibacter oceani]MCM3712912.1 iron export ABC transporter permease subunit FetB [Halalkalibacter oceani]